MNGCAEVGVCHVNGVIQYQLEAGDLHRTTNESRPCIDRDVPPSPGAVTAEHDSRIMITIPGT
eukprot:2000614-Rhodomonas_salina.1